MTNKRPQLHSDQSNMQEPVQGSLHATSSPKRSSRAALKRVAGVGLGIAAVVGSTYWVPALKPLRPFVPGGHYVPFWNIIGREFKGEGEQLSEDARQLAALKQITRAPIPSGGTDPQRTPTSAPNHAAVFPPYSPEIRTARPAVSIEPPEGLDYYFQKLTLVDLGMKGAIARAGHWGDSVLGVDGITSGIRRRLQSRFGDAGHGFHLMDRYNPSYRQQGIHFEPGSGWSRCLVVFECNKVDHRYGYGGLVVQGSRGATSRWSTPNTGFGQTVSLFELWFAYQERGGDFEIEVDGKQKTTVSTRGPQAQDGWFRLPVEQGNHSFTVRASGGGEVRAYGVVLETDGPGVVWDGMALIGGSTRGLRTQDPEHIASQIRHRDLDVLAFMFGGNDMERNYVDLKTSMDPYYEEYGDMLKRFREGKPEASCLIMSLTDHGRRTADGRIVSRKFAKQLSLAQREIAQRNGCAFFDTYEAMGGDGSVARWYSARPPLISPDLGHPNGLGHETIAGLLVNAILYEYDQYRDRMQGKPLPNLLPEVSGTEPRSQSDPSDPDAGT